MTSWVPEAVAARWADFPVDDAPRPVVLLEPRVRVEGGFADNASKIAWMEGAIETSVPVPPTLLRCLPTRGQSSARSALTITAVTPTEAVFRCDRGPRELPAFSLQLTGLHGSCVVLAPEVDLWWPREDVDQDAGPYWPATLDDDGVTLRLSALGGVLTEFLYAEFEEHAAYVVGRAITS